MARGVDRISPAGDPCDGRHRLGGRQDLRRPRAAGGQSDNVRGGAKALCQGCPDRFRRIAAPPKEETFIALVLPNVLRINERIARQGARLVELRATAGRTGLGAADRSWIETLANAFGVSSEDLEELVNRIDVLPRSLAVAQAIDESGWGTSRFAREGNALFGEHMPAGEGGRYLTATRGGARVMAFDSLLNGVAAYIHSINVNPDYREQRRLRASLRWRHGTVDGGELSQGLFCYSARGEAYVRILRELIDRHRLDKLDPLALCRDCGALSVAP